VIGYLGTTPEGTITRVNETFVALTGRSREELLGKVRFQELLTPGGRLFHETHYAPLLHLQDGVREVALDIRRQDGSSIPVLVNSVVRRDAAGQPVAISTAVFPAPERRSYERELLRARDAERTLRKRVERLQSLTARLAAEVDGERVAEAIERELADNMGVVDLTLELVDDSGRELQVVRRLVGSDSADRQSVVLPLNVGERSIGVLQLGFARSQPFAPDERRFLDACANQCAQAIERGRLFTAVAALAGTDELTGLPNRRTLYEHLSPELARAQRSGAPVCLAVLDLDHFKRYNDTYGHSAGDRLLRRVAGAWRGTLRPRDVLARYGGEEFVVLIADSSIAAACPILERLARSMPAGVTCSIGVAEWDGAETGDDLIDRADAALYRAKQLGRDRIEAAPAVIAPLP
jgi:diguanylate cyclase (GGDEF)-like protein/PAS domain S-box-containing protein